MWSFGGGREGGRGRERCASGERKCGYCAAVCRGHILCPMNSLAMLYAVESRLATRRGTRQPLTVANVQT